MIYVLSLKQNKYYIGKTNNIKKRLEQHYKGYGSKWTKKYKPLKLIETFEEKDDFDEDKYTLKYMNNYGIENVRGGSFCEFNVDVKTIKKMLNSKNNTCFKCGGPHFVKDCKTNTNFKHEDFYFVKSRKIIKCFQCGGKSHKSINCYSNYMYGTNCFRCGKNDHWRINCYEKIDILGNILTKRDNICVIS